MSGIWSHGCRPLAPLRIKLPHKFGISVESLRGGYFLHAMPSPKSIGAAKGGETAFGTDAGAGQHEPAGLRCQRLCHCPSYARLLADLSVLVEKHDRTSVGGAMLSPLGY